MTSSLLIIGVSAWAVATFAVLVALPAGVLAVGLALGAGGPWRRRAARRWQAFLTSYADREIDRARRRRQERPRADRGRRAENG
jgi:hypothetical protein